MSTPRITVCHGSLAPVRIIHGNATTADGTPLGYIMDAETHLRIDAYLSECVENCTCEPWQCLKSLVLLSAEAVVNEQVPYSLEDIPTECIAQLENVTPMDF